MNHQDARSRQMLRRHFFQECGLGIGKIALASLLASDCVKSASAAPVLSPPLAPRPPHFAAKAKRIVYFFMGGAPSQLDLFDYKPALVQYDGQPIPPEVVKDQRYAFIRRDARIMAPRFKFARYGQSGAELSEVLPHLAEVVDDLAIVRAMKTDQFNHGPAQLFMNTGDRKSVV